VLNDEGKIVLGKMALYDKVMRNKAKKDKEEDEIGDLHLFNFNKMNRLKTI
jgi:hypothetical protein